MNLAFPDLRMMYGCPYLVMRILRVDRSFLLPAVRAYFGEIFFLGLLREDPEVINIRFTIISHIYKRFHI